MVQETINQKVQRRAKEAFRILAENYNLKIPEKDYPTVTSKESETPFYNPETKTINIPPGKADSAISYFEEASHALRDYVQRKRLIYKLFPFMRPDLYAQEFYGRIGETLGRKLSKGTEFEELFAKEKPRSFKDKETRKDYAKYLRNLRKLKSKTSYILTELSEGRQYLLRKFSDIQDSLKNLYETSSSGKISEDEFKKQFEDIKETLYILPQNKTIKVHKDDLAIVKMWKEDLDRIKDNFLFFIREKDPNSKKILKNHLKEAIDELGDFEKYFLPTEVLSFPTFIKEFSYYTHRKPYEVAEAYNAEELLSIKNLYHLPDYKVSKIFLRKKKETRENKPSQLENIVSSSIIIVSFFLLFFFSKNLILTGKIIDSSTIIGKNLWIIIFVAVIFFIYLILKNHFRKS